MTIRNAAALLTAGALAISFQAGAQAPPAGTPASTVPPSGLPALPTLPAPPAAPGTAPATAAPAIPATGATAPTAPGLPGLPTLPGTGAAPAFPGATPAAAVPTPPPLGDISAGSMDSSTATGAPGLSTAAAPSQLYTFLFIEDPEYGVVRQKFTTDIAAVIKEKEIAKYQDKRRNPQANQQELLGGGAAYGGFAGDPAMLEAGMMDPAMMDPTLGGGAAFGGGVAGQGVAGNAEAIRAAAEWDFYYSQLEMYDRYVREKLIPDAEELPELSYDSSNVLQERQDIFEAFQDAAIIRSDEESNENRAFYERLQRREDRRIAYNQWLLHKENEMAEWTKTWARNINGHRWTDGEEVRVDDWYYGIDFNSAMPVTVAMNDREYVVSRYPVEKLEPGQLNVISSNLTPYDIIDNNGNMKNPQMETLRGTLVVPPVSPVSDTPGNIGGTIEMVPGL